MAEPVSNVDMVKSFLRAQNLEQVGRLEEAIDLYEAMIAGRFDSIGPYDRLIEIYSNRALHPEVVRVATAAIELVHTYEDKLRWYGDIKKTAERAATGVPQATPKKPSG